MALLPVPVKPSNQLSTLPRIIWRKSSIKNLKSSANPVAPFPNKHTVENDPYPFPNVPYPCRCSEQHGPTHTNASMNRFCMTYREHSVS